MDKVLSVGIIGTGGIAQSHMRSIEQLDNIRLAAVMDVYEEKARAAAARFGGRVYTDLDSILADDEVEAVHICTPHSFHADQTVAAAQAGKHVLVEKPMALTVEDCDRMIEACEAAGKILMVGQVMRHYPVNLRIRQMIADREIGEAKQLIRRRYSYFDPTRPDSHYPAWYADLSIGGICVLHCFGPHEYDILPWYLNSPVVEVYAKGTTSSKTYSNQKDSYTAIMTHQNGAVSVLSQSVVCHSGAHDQFIICTEGTILATNNELTVNGKKIEMEATSSVGMLNQIAEFAECCLTGKQPDASGKSVRHTMAVIDAARISAETNRPVAVDI